MADPIGITFMPDAETAAQGPRRGALEGAGGDLTQAFKVLSLHLPRVLGAQAIAPKRLLNSPGASGVPGGFNPSAAVFEALLRAMGSGDSYMPNAGGGSLASLFGGGGSSPSGYGVPNIKPADTGPRIGVQEAPVDTPEDLGGYSIGPNSSRLTGDTLRERRQY